MNSKPMTKEDLATEIGLGDYTFKVKYLKKLIEKPFKEKLLTIIYDEIAVSPHSRERKTADLSGILAMRFKHVGITYRVAYEIKDNTVILVLLCGTYENFYEHLKKIR